MPGTRVAFDLFRNPILRDCSTYDRKQDEQKQRLTRVGLVLKNIAHDTRKHCQRETSFSLFLLLFFSFFFLAVSLSLEETSLFLYFFLSSSFSFLPSLVLVHTRKISPDDEMKMGFWNCWRWQWSPGRLLENLITRPDEKKVRTTGKFILRYYDRSPRCQRLERVPNFLSRDLYLILLITERTFQRKVSQRNCLMSVFFISGIPFVVVRSSVQRFTNGSSVERECQIVLRLKWVTYGKKNGAIFLQ